ncbi:2-oxoglutarate ferredoxin oxidoreductase subunit alpha [candidate division TA06 bacterium DG_24]|uniref:2-oxoglutarate ferredoxin oxidoreductase subunit alpha n=2 Tax=Bacteria division TA06 TaxID=1156500 RepID=A0A0S8JJW6_UNCT6|nr:MAG: 2-oxoglutarate ferredoxin oxidoreductase subunit alpha [candidate division TA06 bacterium DG_24]KPL10089.1 MAG: 2-oxoglutarate ferredoxin oxidoreductase subunit alpha [candidate division TA06 bacterium SM1_40]
MTDREKKTGAPRMMQGNEACVEGALAAGVRFFAGYPITPSSEIMELMAERLPRLGGAFIQMEDEIAAMGAVIGASLVGRKAMTATSGPGFSLKQENLGYASMTEIPCVVVNVQRGGPSTGLPTMPSQGDVMQARWGTHGDHPIVVIVPSSVRETFDLTVRSVNLSERLRVPVVLLLDEIVGHVSEKVLLPDSKALEILERPRPNVPPDEFIPYPHTESDIPPMADFGSGYRYHVTGLCRDETGFPTMDRVEIDRVLRRINRKIERYRAEIIEIEELEMAGARVAVFAYGSTARSARQAVLMARKGGMPVGLLRPRVLWPFPDKEVRAFAERVDAIIVAEMNLGQMVREVERAACEKVEIISMTRVDGEPFRPHEILDQISEVL